VWAVTQVIDEVTTMIFAKLVAPAAPDAAVLPPQAIDMAETGSPPAAAPTLEKPPH
jgi:hypothetical protein